jgi:hypothetical protein
MAFLFATLAVVLLRPLSDLAVKQRRDYSTIKTRMFVDEQYLRCINWRKLLRQQQGQYIETARF